MSVPSSFPHNNKSSSLYTGDDSPRQSPFLDSDERCEVHVVKTAERPHLLYLPSYAQEDAMTDGNPDDDDQNDLPLLDGCDIPGWRQEGIVPVSPFLQGLLNVGAGCVLMRRESLLCCGRLGTSSTLWQGLVQKLQQEPLCKIPRVACEEMSTPVEWKEGFRTTRFAWEWERRNEPVLVEDCTKDWKAMPIETEDGGMISGGWTFEHLLSRFSNILWRFSDNHGEMMPLSTYAKYISNPEGLTDDSPLAIYDAEFGEDDATCELLEEYHVPPCFSPDLFELANTQNRPPYRWILIGPARSGTGLHVDPLWTNAWVTVLQGVKRWLLFPPDTPRNEIGMDGPYQLQSIVWFRDYYDKVTSPSWPEKWKPVECLQRPGETVFVPCGMPHIVLNLELTVAVTQNYASEFGPFERMWEEVVTEEHKFARQWYGGLEQKRPDLARRTAVPTPSQSDSGPCPTECNILSCLEKATLTSAES